MPWSNRTKCRMDAALARAPPKLGSAQHFNILAIRPSALSLRCATAPTGQLILMASIAVVCRVSARAATQQLRNHGARRGEGCCETDKRAVLTAWSSFPFRTGLARCAKLQHARAFSDDDRGQHCDVEDQGRYESPDSAPRLVR